MHPHTHGQPHHLPIQCIIFATIKIPSTEFIWKYEKIKRIPRLPSSFVCTTSTNIHITICPYPTTILNHQVPSKQTTAGIYVRGVVQRSSVVFYHLFTFRVLLLVSTTTFIATHGYYMDSIHDWRWYILVILRSLLKGWGYVYVMNSSRCIVWCILEGCRSMERVLRFRIIFYSVLLHYNTYCVMKGFVLDSIHIKMAFSTPMVSNKK